MNKIFLSILVILLAFSVIFIGCGETPSDGSNPDGGSGNPAHTHSWKWQTIAAPSEESGLEIQMCSCGETGQTREIAPIGGVQNVMFYEVENQPDQMWITWPKVQGAAYYVVYAANEIVFNTDGSSTSLSYRIYPVILDSWTNITETAYIFEKTRQIYLITMEEFPLTANYVSVSAYDDNDEDIAYFIPTNYTVPSSSLIKPSVMPVTNDFNIAGTGNLVYNGEEKIVYIGRKANKSTGEITVYYNGETESPVNAGTYAVTFDVAMAPGFNAATGFAAGTLVINKAAGAAVSAPAETSTLRKTSITVKAVTAPANGQTVEYAISTSNSAPSTGWQDGRDFSNLTAGTNYFLFARSKGNDNYNTGAASSSLRVTTKPADSYELGERGEGGGIIVYVSEEGFYVNGFKRHYLEIRPDNAGGSAYVYWSQVFIDVPNTSTAFGTGWKNTKLINEKDSKADAARWAAYSYGGFDDWFLPSFGDFEACDYYTLYDAIPHGYYWTSSNYSEYVAWMYRHVIRWNWGDNDRANKVNDGLYTAYMRAGPGGSVGSTAAGSSGGGNQGGGNQGGGNNLAPWPPSGIQVTGLNGGIYVTWLMGQGPDADSYDVYYSTSMSGPWSYGASSVHGVTNVAITGLSSNTIYWVKIVARNSAGSNEGFGNGKSW